MATVVFGLAAFPAALVLLVAACAELYRALRARSRGQGTAAGVLGCAGVAVLGALGTIRPATAIALACLCAGAAAALTLVKGWRGSLGEITGETGAAFGRLGADIRRLWQRLGGRLAALRGEEEAAPGLPAEAVRAAVASRAIPPLGADPSLGAPPEPAAITAAAPVPPPYAALASWIAGFEAADDQDLRMLAEGCAAGNVAVAEAWHQFGDRCLDSRLHPAYVAGILEVGDTEAQSAASKIQAHRRFAVIYGAVKEWISGNGPLPKDGDFLTGEN